MIRGILVGALHCLIVLSLTGKYALDRERLPRVWAKAAPFRPDHPMRGRYLSLAVEVEFTERTGAAEGIGLAVEEHRLVGRAEPRSALRLRPGSGTTRVLAQPVAFFVPEHAPDPSRVASGEGLWVEVSIPPAGPPRPIRLGVKRDGVVTPLKLDGR